jgi:hypothetical protein
MNSRLLTFALFAALLAVVGFARSGFDGASPAVAVLQTETPTPTETPLPTDTPTLTPTVTLTPTPTATATPGVVAITITPASRFLGCAATTSITVSASTATGPVPDGTPFSISVNIGTVTPTSGTTAGGGFFAIYTAPPTSGGIVVITVTVAGATAATDLVVGCPVAPAVLGFPTTQCIGFPSVSATVTFHWQPAEGAVFQFLDISLSSHFAPGTFLGAGPLSPFAGQLTWAGILPNHAHFWRVNALTPQGWVTSAVGAFTPCANPIILTPTYVCTGGGRATVTFHWAPSSPPGLQWLDLSLFNNGFVPGTFLAAGPLHPATQAISWPGILANTVHFWRVNALIWGWNPSATGSFIAFCP